MYKNSPRASSYHHIFDIGNLKDRSLFTMKSAFVFVVLAYVFCAYGAHGKHAQFGCILVPQHPAKPLTLILITAAFLFQSQKHPRFQRFEDHSYVGRGLLNARRNARFGSGHNATKSSTSAWAMEERKIDKKASIDVDEAQ